MSGDSPNISVMLADDHNMVRSGLRLLLDGEDDIEVVAETRDADETVRRIKGHKPNILVLDLFMPGRAPIETVPEILENSPETRIIVLTMQDDVAYVKEAFSQGVHGYLIKDAADEELAEAIRTVHDGNTYLHPSLGARLAFQDSKEDDEAAKLSGRELEVLKLVGLGFTNKEIAGQLFLSVRTIESHRASFQEKLGITSRAEIVRWALEHDMLQISE